MNITLIGMPGSGKSTVGKALAQRLGYSFVDIDKLIEEKELLPLQDILDKLGDEKFLELEEEVVLGLNGLYNSIISPGGSIVYMEKAMKHLGNNSTIVYLDVPLQVIKGRLSASPKRGIVRGSVEDVFAERSKLYQKYADFTIPADNEINTTVDRLKFYILNNIPLD